MNRQEANQEIIKILSRWVHTWPEARFGQLLINLNVILLHEDPFMTESSIILKRLIQKDEILQKEQSKSRPPFNPTYGDLQLLAKFSKNKLFRKFDPIDGES